MKNKIGIVHKFAYSISNFKSYREFVSQGMLKGILYLFIISAIFSTLGNISIISAVNDDITRLENKYAKESPEFELKDGVLSIDSKEPVIYKYSGDSPVLDILLKEFLIGDVLISDTSGTTDVSALDDYSNGTYIDSKSIYAKKNGEMFASIDFSENSSLVLNKESLKNYFSLFKKAFSMVLLILNPIIDFLDNLISVFLLIGPMTLIFSRNFKVNLNYRQCSIIGMYALTLPLILKSLATILNLSSYESTVVIFSIAFIYSILAVKNINSAKKIDSVL